MRESQIQDHQRASFLLEGGGWSTCWWLEEWWVGLAKALQPVVSASSLKLVAFVLPPSKLVKVWSFFFVLILLGIFSLCLHLNHTYRSVFEHWCWYYVPFWAWRGFCTRRWWRGFLLFFKYFLFFVVAKEWLRISFKVDLDLGNYERFLDVTLTKDNNITTGKIYQVGTDFDVVAVYFGFTWLTFSLFH